MFKGIPYGERVIIKAIEPNEISSGGIIVPDAGKEKAMPGKVIAVGPGVVSLVDNKLMPTVTKVGDTVIYPKYGCHTFEIDGEEFLVCKESELFLNLGQ
jgi:chaperonin GroES